MCSSDLDLTRWRNNSQLAPAQGVAIKVGRQLRCSSVTYFSAQQIGAASGWSLALRQPEFGADAVIAPTANCRSLNEERLGDQPKRICRIKGGNGNSHSCTTTGTLSPGFNFGRPRVVTTTLPHSPEGGNPPIWFG